MDSMSHNQTATEIGLQVVQIGNRGIQSVAATAASVSGLVPAGSEAVSITAASKFMEHAAQILPLITTALEELAQAGTMFVNVGKAYEHTDEYAADVLTGVAPTSDLFNRPLLVETEQALPATAGSATRTPITRLTKAPSSLLTQTAANAGSSVGSGAAPLAQTAANAGSSVGSGAAPLGPMGHGAAGGTPKSAGLVTAHEEEDDDEEDDELRRKAHHSGKQLL